VNIAARWMVVLATVVWFAVPASHGHAATANGPVSQDVPVLEILVTEYAFGPTESVVAAGAVQLRIINAGIRRHNLVLLLNGVEVASPEVRPGDTVDWEIQIDRPGRYLYWCGEYRHLEKGMTGALIVN
jgi:plastocyanin